MKKAAFLTSDNYQSILEQCPDFLDEFTLLQKAFLKEQIELVKMNWRDQAADWSQFICLIPKGCWDYSERPRKFADFLKQLQAKKIVMQNPLETVIWNMRKNYLVDLKNRGLNVAELKLIPEKSTLDFGAWMKEFAPAQVIVAKPSISGGARNTIRCQARELTEHAALLNTILKDSDLILQPYFSEIATEGEYSFFFFGGEFSHAILKLPAQGDFRAHQLFGGKNQRYSPTEAEVQEAKVFADAAPEKCAYARVDVFKKDDRFWLIELELIEPYLYFEHTDAQAIEKFCRAVLKY